jgi:hypothetical protein
MTVFCVVGKIATDGFMLETVMYDYDDWPGFKPADYKSNTDGVWFLFEPAEPPFPCTEAAAKIWYQMEREMWEFCVSKCCTDEVEQLFPVQTPAIAYQTSALPSHLL